MLPLTFSARFNHNHRVEELDPGPEKRRGIPIFSIGTSKTTPLHARWSVYLAVLRPGTIAGSSRKYKPNPTSSREIRAVHDPRENHSTFCDVMKAILMTYSAESKKSVPPTAKRTIPTSCLGSIHSQRNCHVFKKKR